MKLIAALLISVVCACSKRECPPAPAAVATKATPGTSVEPTIGELLEGRSKRFMANPFAPDYDPQIKFAHDVAKPKVMAAGLKVTAFPDEHGVLSFRFDDDNAPSCDEPQLAKIAELIGVDAKAIGYTRLACDNNAAQVKLP